MSLETRKKSIQLEAGNFIYLFVDDKYLTSNRYFGKYTERIKAKKADQQKYLKALVVADGGGLNLQSNYNTVIGWIREAIAETYAPLKNTNTGRLEDATPEGIIYYLSQGIDVAGKNWSKGIYGCKVGSIVTTTGDFSVDANTGIVTKNGSASGLIQSPIYNNGKQTGTVVYDAKGGNSLTTDLTDSGYSLGTITGNNGVTTDVSTGNQRLQNTLLFFQNLNALMPQIQNLISSIATSLSGVTAQSITASQVGDGWYEEKDSKSGLITTAALAGGALLIGSTLINDKKK